MRQGITAGKYRHRVTLEEPLVTQNPNTGEEDITWISRGDVWASIEPLTGREALQADMVSAQLDTRISVRWHPIMDELVAKWRIRHQDDIYDVITPRQVDMMRREVQIMCRSGRNRG